MPRVLALTVGFEVGGAEQLILATAPRLRARGFDVHVAALKGPGPIMTELEAAGVPCTALGAASRLDLSVVPALAAILRRGRFDILHSHLFLANVVGRIAGRLAGVKAIVSAHHDTDVWMGPHHRLVERLSARLADRVVTCSDVVRDWAVRTIGLPVEKVRTLRNAIEPPAPVSEEERARTREALGLGPDDLVAGTLGRLHEPKKGLTVFIEAAAQVAAASPAARFVVAGSGPDRERLERAAAAAGIRDLIRFPGERRDIYRLLAAYDLFVQPSLWEGFGLTVVEAMAAGRAVVATAVGGHPEILRHGVDGLLVAPGDAPALAGAMIALLRDPARRDRLGLAARARALDEFGIDRLVDDTVSLYLGLLASRRATRPLGRRAA